MIVSTPCLRRTGTSALTLSASSKKSTDAMPAWLTIDGVPSRVMPMIPTLMPLKCLIAKGGKMVLPLSL